MHIKFNPYKAFFVSVLASVFLGYTFNSGVIAYGPLIVFGFTVILYELILIKPIKINYLMISLAWLPYIAWAGFIYVSNPYEGRYLTTHLLSILILPVTTLSFFRLLYSESRNENYYLIYRLLLLFVALQLIICVGQISTYTFGIGLPVSELYADYGMVTGTFTNSNDLGAVVLVISFFVLGLEKFYFKKDQYLFWFLAATLLIVTGSRSAILLAVILFVLSKANSPKKILIYSFLSLLIGFFFIVLVNEVENVAFTRFAVRIKSLVNVLQHGTSADNSMSMRISSYLHFINKLPELGFGSGEVNNYLKYSGGADFRVKELHFRNPHSLIVEIGYWLGWPGLIFFFMPILFLISYSKRKLAMIAILLTASMIPSSVIGNMLFLMLAILIFFDFNNKKNNRLLSY